MFVGKVLDGSKSEKKQDIFTSKLFPVTYLLLSKEKIVTLQWSSKIGIIL
jgi:hypothetical protein